MKSLWKECHSLCVESIKDFHDIAIRRQIRDIVTDILKDQESLDESIFTASYDELESAFG